MNQQAEGQRPKSHQIKNKAHDQPNHDYFATGLHYFEHCKDSLWADLSAQGMQSSHPVVQTRYVRAHVSTPGSQAKSQKTCYLKSYLKSS